MPTANHWNPLLGVIHCFLSICNQSSFIDLENNPFRKNHIPLFLKDSNLWYYIGYFITLNVSFSLRLSTRHENIVNYLWCAFQNFHFQVSASSVDSVCFLLLVIFLFSPTCILVLLIALLCYPLPVFVRTVLLTECSPISVASAASSHPLLVILSLFPWWSWLLAFTSAWCIDQVFQFTLMPLSSYIFKSVGARYYSLSFS